MLRGVDVFLSTLISLSLEREYLPTVYTCARTPSSQSKSTGDGQTNSIKNLPFVCPSCCHTACTYGMRKGAAAAVVDADYNYSRLPNK